MRCPLGCPKACELVDVGADRLDQSGWQFLPARRFAAADCPRQVVAIAPTGEPARAYPLPEVR
jgi:hypothetical protein